MGSMPREAALPVSGLDTIPAPPPATGQPVAGLLSLLGGYQLRGLPGRFVSVSRARAHRYFVWELPNFSPFSEFFPPCVNRVPRPAVSPPPVDGEGGGGYVGSHRAKWPDRWQNGLTHGFCTPSRGSVVPLAVFVHVFVYILPRLRVSGKPF